MNARQVARQVLDGAKVPLTVAGKAVGLSAVVVGIGIELVKDTLRQRAEAKRLRIVDKRRRKP